MRVPTMRKRTADRVGRFLSAAIVAGFGLGLRFLDSDLDVVLYVGIPSAAVVCAWRFCQRAS